MKGSSDCFRREHAARCDEFVLRVDQQDLARAGVGRAPEQAEDRGRRARQRLGRRSGAQVMREEQRRDGVARAVDRDRQFRRAHAEAAGGIRGDQIDRIGGRLVGVQRRHQDRLRPERVHGVDRRKRCLTRRAAAPGQQVELELVRRDEVRRRHRLVAHELRNARPHEHAAPDIADHRIAAVFARADWRPAPARPHRGSRRRSRPNPCSRRARRRIVRARRAPRCRARASVISAGLEHAAGPLAVAGVIGELHGVHRPHLDADALQRKRRRGVADMPVGDVRLDREDVHDRP